MENEVQIKLQEFEVSFYSVDTSKYVESNCNTITFTNFGTSVVKIESITLQPSQSFEIGGNGGEYTKQRFFINFGGVTLGNLVVVTIKRYII